MCNWLKIREASQFTVENLYKTLQLRNKYYRSKTAKPPTTGNSQGLLIQRLPCEEEVNMVSISLNESSKTISVPFYGSDLYVVNYNGEPYVPMKPIVDGMGLAW